MKAIGKITVDGVGFVDIIDEDSLLIGEYFLEYMRKKLNAGDHTDIQMRMRINGDKRSDMAMEKEIETHMKNPVIYDENSPPISENISSVEEYLESPQGKKDTLTLMQSHDKPKKKSKRGRKKGDMMSCEDKIKKYVENKSSFYIKSFLNRQPRFTEDEIKRAISVLIKENYLYQISNEEIGVVGKKTRSVTGSHQEQ